LAGKRCRTVGSLEAHALPARKQSVEVPAFFLSCGDLASKFRAAILETTSGEHRTRVCAAMRVVCRMASAAQFAGSFISTSRHYI